MKSYGSAPPSARQSIGDLDGYTLHDYNFPMHQAYAPAEQGDFGFDPPTMPTQEPQQIYTPPARKRRTTRVKPATDVEDVDAAEDSKRKASLEKNRLAAAKCRNNMKKKTEQLQRNSHDKAVHNAFLKDQTMRMKEEIQQMNTVLLSHADCEGCKSPEDIQKHLCLLGNEYLSQQRMPQAQNYGQYLQVQITPDDYFSSMIPEGDSTLLNSPLPEFNCTGEF